MLDYTRPAPGEKIDRVAVVVTFLRMKSRPDAPPLPLPEGAKITQEIVSLAQYRRLYHEVGAPWLWWLRRVMTDEALAKHLANLDVRLYVLRVDGKIAGFFETDASPWPDVNLNYFGLLPDMIGRGLGKPLLDAAIERVFANASRLRGMTLNTCTADHPRALPNYLAAGFVELRRMREVWEIPQRLGFTVPGHLRV